MANDGKIYILITNKLPGGTEDTVDPNKVESEKDSESALGSFARHEFFNLIERQAKQAVSLTINNIGNFTGDYEGQRHISALMEIGNRAMAVGAAAVSGAKWGSWGAVIAAAVTATSITLNDITSEVMKDYADKKKNLAILQLRARSGMYPLLDGNRGTEN